MKCLKFTALLVLPILSGLIAYLYYPTTTQINPIPTQALIQPSIPSKPLLKICSNLLT